MLDTERRFASRSGAFDELVDLRWGHWVFASECALEIRDGWIDSPTSPPDTSCVADMDRIAFTTE
jgi:hypothetical protein